MTVVWGWVLIVGMTLSVALPMAEICSSLPTTGGVYYWWGGRGRDTVDPTRLADYCPAVCLPGAGVSPLQTTAS